MRTVAIVTPYFKESAGTLARCVASVKELKHAGKVLHIVVADGHPQDWLDKVDGIIYLRLPVNSNNWGNTPRCLGGLFAVAQEAEYVAFLDADCTFDSDHIEVCLKVMAESASEASPVDVVIARRRLRRPDWSLLSESDLDNPDINADTNCFFSGPLGFWFLGAVGFAAPPDNGHL
jgi:glycosyltransferase involved in cell wall biosynthesis